MTTKRKTVFALSALFAGALIAFLVWGNIVASTPRHFALGITLDQARRQLTQPVEVRDSHRSFGPSGPTERDKEFRVFREIISERDGVWLGFNYYDRLVLMGRLNTSASLCRVNRYVSRPM